MPSGDLALVGVLADGRVSVLRGSEKPARRFAPRIVSPAGKLEVLDLAAAATPDGLAILALRAPHQEDAAAPRKSMEYELFWLDAGGAQLRSPVRWQTATGFNPRLVTCNRTQFLAWQSNQGVVTSTVSATSERSPEKIWRTTRGVAANLGPLVCAGDGARLFSGVRKDPTVLELLPRLDVAELPAAISGKGSQACNWQTLALPAPPYANFEQIGVSVNTAGVQLVVQADSEAKLVTLAPGRAWKVAHELAVPRGNGLRLLDTGKAARAVRQSCLGSRARAVSPALFHAGAPAATSCTRDLVYERGQADRRAGLCRVL